MLHFDLSQQMVAQIAEIIGNAPYRIAAPILAELQKQIDAQQPSNGKAIEVENALTD